MSIYNEKGITVLSLFDGMSCGQIALQKLGIKVDKYYASEIENKPIQVTQANFPDTVQLGDVTKIKYEDGILYTENGEFYVGEVDLLLGGSPCQDLSSINNKNLGLEGEKSKLFYTFLRILGEVKPSYFLLENVSMNSRSESIISNLLNTKPLMINSNLVSAQNRKRLYWTNINAIALPNDEGIFLKDILDINVNNELFKDYDDSSFVGKKYKVFFEKHEYIPKMFNPYNVKEITDKSPTLTTGCGGATSSSAVLIEKEGLFRKLTINECEKLQTIPINYSKVKGVSKSARFEMIGNAWTVDVIAHILKHAEF